MQVINYNLYNEEINLKKINLINNIVYEIIKKYIANSELETM